MRKPQCAATQRRLATLAGVADELGRTQRHYDQCLRCQAEAVKYRRLARGLAALAETHEPAPPGLVAAVEHQIAGLQPVAASAQGSGQPTRAAAAVVGALAAAAGTAVVVRMLRTRSAA